MVYVIVTNNKNKKLLEKEYAEDAVVQDIFKTLKNKNRNITKILSNGIVLSKEAKLCDIEKDKDILFLVATEIEPITSPIIFSEIPENSATKLENTENTLTIKNILENTNTANTHKKQDGSRVNGHGLQTQKEIIYNGVRVFVDKKDLEYHNGKLYYVLSRRKCITKEMVYDFLKSLATFSNGMKLFLSILIYLTNDMVTLSIVMMVKFLSLISREMKKYDPGKYIKNKYEIGLFMFLSSLFLIDHHHITETYVSRKS